MTRVVKVAAILPCLLLLAAAPLEKAATSYVRKAAEVVDSGVVVIPGAEDRKVAGDIRAYSGALKKPTPKYPVNLGLNLVSAGPRLDSSDEVTIGKLERKDHDLTLNVTYTSGRVRGEERSKNTPWTPLVFELIPNDLAPGPYTLTVTWQCTDEPAAGVKKPDDLALRTTFELTAEK